MASIQINRFAPGATATALLLGTTGLVSTSVAVSWLIASQNLSQRAAERIVQATALGGWALAIVGAIVGAGIAGIVIASTRAFLMRFGAAAAIR